MILYTHPKHDYKYAANRPLTLSKDATDVQLVIASSFDWPVFHLTNALIALVMFGTVTD